MTFVGLFDIGIAEGSQPSDMVEQQTNRPPIPDSQHAPHEGGNGSPGLPRTVHESAKPPPEGSAHGERQSTLVQQSQPETEAAPTPAKRLRGRPRLPVKRVDESTSVPPGNWLDRVEDLHWKEQYMKQVERSRTYQKANRDKVNAQRRKRYKERKEQGKLPPRKQQPKQVYPSPIQE